MSLPLQVIETKPNPVMYPRVVPLDMVLLKGCGMGPLLVLVSPCFRENVYSCHMQNWVLFVWFRYFTSEKRNCFLFWKSNFKMVLIWKKRAIFGLLFTLFSHQGKNAKIPSARISLTYIHVFCSPYWLFCFTNCEKIRIYQVWFLFGVIPSVNSYSRHFGTINK